MADILAKEKQIAVISSLAEGSSIRSIHLRTALVIEGWKQEIVWQGEVEVFVLKGHPKAKLAFGWKNQEGNFTAVLGIPPVESPNTAVRAAIAAKARG